MLKKLIFEKVCTEVFMYTNVDTVHLLKYVQSPENYFYFWKFHSEVVNTDYFWRDVCL